MIQSQELVIAGFPAKSFLAAAPSFQKEFWMWKVLLVFAIFLFSFVARPATEAREISLSPDNLVKIINQDRIKQGLYPLEENKTLQTAAYAKARDILLNDYFAHTSPAGVKPWEFIKSAGFAYGFAGENLALNYSSPYELEQDFLKSPNHRENLLSPLFSQIGIAVVSGTLHGQPAVITVQMFAAPE
jgi:uncharacterized protein YkwD